MITEEDYKWYPPSANCTYTGYPIPKLDEIGASTDVIKKEDVCYLLDWMKDIRVTFYYGYKNNRTWPTFDYANQYTGIKTDVMNARDTLGPYGVTGEMKYFYCLSCGSSTSYDYSANTGSLCTFSLSGNTWEDYWSSLTAWHPNLAQYGYDQGECYGFYYAPISSTRMRDYRLSDMFNQPGLTSYSQYNYLNYSAPAVADVLRMCYYNLNRIENVGWCTNDIQTTDGTIIDKSIKGYIWYYKPWTTSYANQAIRGPLADDTYNWRYTATYISGNYISTDIKQLTCDYSGTYIPKGDPTHAIYDSCTYKNPELWQQMTRTYRYEQQQITYRNGGNPHYIVTPMLKNKIKKLAILEVMMAEGAKRNYTDSENYKYVYFWRINTSLTKVADHEGYETWEDTSGYWNDSTNMMNDMKAGVMQAFGWDHVYQFYGSRTSIGAFFIQLDTGEWKYWFPDWNWTPSPVT